MLEHTRHSPGPDGRLSWDRRSVQPHPTEGIGWRHRLDTTKSNNWPNRPGRPLCRPSRPRIPPPPVLSLPNGTGPGAPAFTILGPRSLLAAQIGLSRLAPADGDRRSSSQGTGARETTAAPTSKRPDLG